MLYLCYRYCFHHLAKNLAPHPRFHSILKVVRENCRVVLEVDQPSGLARNGPASKIYHPLSLIEAVFVHLYVRHDIGRQIILLDISFLSYLPRNVSLGALHRHHAMPFLSCYLHLGKKCIAQKTWCSILRHSKKPFITLFLPIFWNADCLYWCPKCFGVFLLMLTLG